MPEITPKSNEAIQAQIASFAAERVQHPHDEEYIFNNIGILAVGGLEDVTRVTSGTEYYRDENNKTSKIPYGTERTVAKRDEYLGFLRSVGGSSYESIGGRAEILKAYADFAPAIMQLKEELADPATRKEHPAHLGSGLNSEVFSIGRDDKKYAVRLPRGKAVDPRTVDSHVSGACLSKGAPHLEQIVAASYESGVTVAELMPGKEMGSVSVADIQAITNDQLADFMDTLVDASNRGLVVDPKPSNFLYDRDAGFGAVDLHPFKEGHKKQYLSTLLGKHAIHVIADAGTFSKPSKTRMTAEDYTSELEYRKAQFEVIKRYRAVASEKLQGNTRDTVLEAIDEKILIAEKDDYDDPEWVAKRLARDEKRRQRTTETNRQALSAPDYV